MMTLTSDGQQQQRWPRLHFATAFNSLTFFRKVSSHCVTLCSCSNAHPHLLSNTFANTNRVRIIHDREREDITESTFCQRASTLAKSTPSPAAPPAAPPAALPAALPSLPSICATNLQSHLFLEQKIVLAIYVRPCCNGSGSAGKCQKAAATTHTLRHTHAALPH